MSMISEKQYLERAIDQFEKTGKRFYREQGVMVVVNEQTINRYKAMTRKAPLK